MRVLITTDTVGGVWTYTRELVSGLLAEDVSVVLVTLGRALNPAQRAWTEFLAGHYAESFTLAETSYRLEWMEDAGHDVEKSCKYVESVIWEHQPDLLHTNQFCFASLDLPMPVVLAAHSEVQSWWRAVHGAAPPETGWQRRYSSLVREGVHGASVVIAPTRWMLNEIENDYGIKAHAQVIANGCSPHKFQIDNPKQMQAVSLGRFWDKGKNIQILEQVQTSVPILIGGEMQAPEGSTSLAFAMPPNSSLRYLGVLAEHETTRLLARSTIYVATSRYEPFGLAAVEAAFSGCAILANDIPSLREVWGNDALYYSQNDAGSLASNIERLAEDSVLLRQLAQSANCRARAQFTASRMISAYLDLYNNALQLNLSSTHV